MLGRSKMTKGAGRKGIKGSKLDWKHSEEVTERYRDAHDGRLGPRKQLEVQGNCGCGVRVGNARKAGKLTSHD